MQVNNKTLINLMQGNCILRTTASWIGLGESLLKQVETVESCKTASQITEREHNQFNVCPTTDKLSSFDYEM